MARFRVMQSRNGCEPYQVGQVTRRFNGAVSVRDEHVAQAASHLRSKMMPEDRVVVGPTTVDPDGPQGVVLVTPDTLFVITTWIERLASANRE